MGTRNLTIVYLDGEYKVAQYGQWDGYPSGNGKVCLEFAQSLYDKYTLDAFTTAVRNCSYASIDTPQSEIESNNRNIGADILDYVIHNDGALLVDDLGFAADSLFCEWAYVIDLDNKIFDVYDGFNKTRLQENDRFFFLQADDPMHGDYYPIRLLKRYDLNNLPDVDTFVEECEAEFIQREHDDFALKILPPSSDDIAGEDHITSLFEVMGL